MGHAKVKDEQFRVIEDVVRVRDTFVSLPTGYGKSLCYCVLPWVFDELSRYSTKRSIVIVVSPLISLTAIQVTFVAKRTGNCFLDTVLRRERLFFSNNVFAPHSMQLSMTHVSN